MQTLTVASLEAAVKALPGIQGMLLEKQVLLSVFRSVENAKDPRGPIDAKIHADLCEVSPEVIVRAVEFFTATTPKVTREGEYLVVKSAGYRAGPAGDH
jgi:hypothetical protein